MKDNSCMKYCTEGEIENGCTGLEWLLLCWLFILVNAWWIELWLLVAVQHQSTYLLSLAEEKIKIKKILLWLLLNELSLSHYYKEEKS